ncbi:MAG: hypothetical protein JNL42_12900 [Anaerolineae bacterium]|nr:hypothetical protein [Anaerolineae bacterium]
MIDRAPARHYGFTEAELDFILHYDIKYRLGKDAESGRDAEITSPQTPLRWRGA